MRFSEDMAVLIFDEHLADILDECTNRRGRWMDIRLEQDREIVREHEQVIREVPSRKTIQDSIEEVWMDLEECCA